MTRLLISLSLLLATTARAEPRIKRALFVDPPPADTQAAGDRVASRTRLRVVVGGASPGLRTQDFALQTKLDELPVTIAAERSVPFAQSDEELAIMILVQGTVRFMGTDGDDDGYHDVVAAAVESIARARTRHTRVGLYVYGDTVMARVPMGPPENVTAASLGARAEYAAIAGKALQRGLEEALRVLSAEAGRRALFVIGDGGDQVASYSARRDLERLEAAGIEVYALGANPRETEWRDRGRLQAMGALGVVRFANQKEQVPQLAEVLVNDLQSVYTVEFPELQSDGQRMPTDGEEHDVTVKAGTEVTEALTLVFPGPLGCVEGDLRVRCVCATNPPTIGPPCHKEDPPTPGWVWASLGLALAAAAGGVVWIVRRRPVEADEEEPPPAPEPPPMIALPPPVAPDPRRTVALQPLVDDGEIPLVGWIVPVTGASAFQTFRLGERTVIGAAPDCHVRIEDPLMSGHHAEIFLTNGDFVLVDRDSRNGVRFYDKKVTRHTLVDNDLFTLGATSFKFKWTM